MLTVVLKAVKDAVLHKDHVLPTAAHNHQPTETYPSHVNQLLQDDQDNEPAEE